MLTLADGQARLLFDRREFLRVGSGLAVAGFSLPPLGAAQSANARDTSGAPGGAPLAQSCILVYLLGGPSHIDSFDLKPDAPAEYRGPFQPIKTNVPGTHICEHLPRLATIADRYSLVRSVSHRNSNHTPMIYYTLTGRHTDQPERDNDIRPPQPTDFPHLGAVVARYRRSAAGLPGYVALPEVAIRSSIRGEYRRARTPLRGGGAGFLGPKYEALAVDGEPGTAAAIPALSLAPEVSSERLERRAALLSLLDQHGPAGPETFALADLRQRAVLMTGSASRGQLPVFSLEAESPRLRDRYGRHRFGQSLLLARRLAEAGVPMIAIHFNEMTVCDGWDTHSKNFEALQSELLPMLDQGLSALLEDLDQRGRLDQTLVVCLGEFGRTPKINPNAGRDHWGECSSALLAGGGIRGGRVVGVSDKIAASPASGPVDPVDIQATIYHCLGLNPELTIVDHSRRPWTITAGRPVRKLF
jgi:hypothetical protein